MGAIISDTREKQRKWDAKRAHQRSNISPIPKPQNTRRRNACGKSLRLFLETYFPEAFPIEWSADHLEVIEKTQAAVLGGGQFALAMPRGSGKTTIHQRAAIWAINYGLCPYVFIVCADAEKANNGLRSIKTEYEFNPLLFQDFPEICKPIRELQGVSQAAVKQHVDGVPTLIDWTAKRAQLPQVKGSLASGAMIGVGGITGAARGAQVTLPGGGVKRPSLVLVDDFQTRESAASPKQCKTRLDTITGDLPGMRGPGDPMSMLLTGTVIYRGDAMDQLLDRKRFPEWHGVRKKLVYSWPSNEKLWEEYGEIRQQELREDKEPLAASAFYVGHREEMDAGAVVAWPARKLSNEVSALQHAFNLRIADPDAFDSEYQNEPASLVDDDLNFLTADQIADKLNNLPKGELPGTVEQITAAIDVQGNSLYWMVVAWADGFTGYVCDYGCFPKQGRRFYSQRELSHTFLTAWPTLTEEEAIYKGLKELTDSLLARRWSLENNATLGIGRVMIDEGYKDSTVHLFCRTGGHSSLVMPAKGFGVKAGDTPMNERARKKFERVGWNWRVRLGEGNRTIRHCAWDANAWKTFIHQRLAVQLGGNGCLSLWGEQALEHRHLAQHLTAEYPIRTEGRGRTVVEWTLRPNKPDNHWLDCLAMCAVGASEQGIRTLEGEKKKLKQPPKTLAELQVEARKRA
mgnify:FL=1